MYQFWREERSVMMQSEQCQKLPWQKTCGLSATFNQQLAGLHISIIVCMGNFWMYDYILFYLSTLERKMVQAWLNGLIQGKKPATCNSQTRNDFLDPSRWLFVTLNKSNKDLRNIFKYKDGEEIVLVFFLILFLRRISVTVAIQVFFCH